MKLGKVAVLLVAVCVASVLVGACTLLRPTTVPMPSTTYGGGGVGNCLLVMLPGRASRPGDFANNGFISTLREAGFDAQVVTADAHVGYYRKGTLIERLRNDVVEPARMKSQRKVFLVGISLGGTGAILYARAHPEDVCGVLLIAPFLGSRETVEEVTAAGGLAAFEPPWRTGKRFERDVWEWLKASTSQTSPAIPIYLGYGAEDDLATAHRLLAAALPPDHVFTVAGGHDWRAWRAVWAEFLRSPALACGGCSGGYASPAASLLQSQHAEHGAMGTRR